MDYMKAMEDTMTLAERVWPRLDAEHHVVPDSLGIDHIRHMAMDMRHRKMSPMKANRYLGWMQCAVVSWCVGITLDHFKAINTAHRFGEQKELQND